MLEFTREFAQWSPERFVRRSSSTRCAPRLVVVGRDTRFGHRNSGDVATLRELGAELGFDVEIVDGVARDRTGGTGDGAAGAGRRRWVRELLAEGDVAGAARGARAPAPGRPAWSCTATTAAASSATRPPTCPRRRRPVPADGVYAGWLCARSCRRMTRTPSCRPPSPSARTRPSTASSAGSRPTCSTATTSTCTASGSRVEFVERLRPTLRFDGVEALVAQMAADVARCREVLGVPDAVLGAV